MAEKYPDDENQIIAGIGNVDINRRHIKFTTINCSGAGTDVPDKPTRRCDLLNPVIEEADVVAIQALEFKEELETRFGGNLGSHHMVFERGGENRVCMLLKKTAFPSPESAPECHFEQFSLGQCLIVKATPNGWNKSVLFVSYKGKYKTTQENKIQGVVDLVTWLQSDDVPKANCIMIGGNFNLDVTHMNPGGLRAIGKHTVLQFNVASCGRPAMKEKSVRHDKEDIDYFLYHVKKDVALHVVDPPARRQFDRKAFQDDLSYDWKNETDKYERLKKYLAHDPITITMELRDPPANQAPPADQAPPQEMSQPMSIAQEVLKKIETWARQRRNTITLLRDVASSMETIHTITQSVKLTGSTGSIAGGAALSGGGLGGVGTVTSLVASGVDVALIQSKMSDGRTALKNDEEHTNELSELIAKLHDVCKEKIISDKSEATMHPEQMMAGYLLSAVGGQTQFSHFLIRSLLRGDDDLFGFTGLGWHARVQTALKAGVYGGLAGMALAGASAGGKQAAKAGAAAAGKVAGKVAGVAAAAAVGAFSIAIGIMDMRNALQELDHCSTAEQLCDAAGKLQQQLDEAETDLKKYTEFSRWLERLKEKLEGVISVAEASDQQVKALLDVVEENMKDFADAVNKHGKRYALVNGLRFLFTDLNNEISKKRLEQDDSKHYHLVIISHGGINSSPDPLVKLTAGGIQDIIFYSPWGCLVNCSVVHGIATGTINPFNRRFHNIFPFNPPADWNYMSRSGSFKVPSVELHALRPSEGAWQDLLAWKTLVNQTPKRLVIPYVIPPEDEKAGGSLPHLPLWLVAGMCSIIGLVMRVSFTYHHAACLSKIEAFTDAMADMYNQQYSFRQEPGALMTADLGITSHQFAAFQRAIDPILRQGPDN